jgi:hypothetical protein
MKNVYSLLATLAMFFSMPALATSLMERIPEYDCRDPEFRAAYPDEDFDASCYIDQINVERKIPRGGSPICERGGA